MSRALDSLGRARRWLESLRVVRYAWDNPSAEADARTILSSPKVGGWLGLEVLLLIVVGASTLLIAPAEEREIRDLLEVNGAGAVLIDASFLLMAALFTLLFPFRAAGLLEGPRWRGYLDQVITTGVSPLRYFAGKWATTQPLLAGLLLAALPFVMLYGLLGGANWGRVVVGFALLFLYANLILAVVCGLSALLHEVAAVVVTLAIFVGLFALSVLPVPSVIGSFTPVRYFIQPMIAPLGGAEAAMLAKVYGDPNLLGLHVPWLLWVVLSWAALAGCAALCCALGPLHTFVPCLNNFGALVFPGDKKRFRFRKVRPFLTRRTELAFLFDNRSPRIGRWALPLRALQLSFVLGGLALVLFSAAFANPVMSLIVHEAVFVMHTSATVIVLVLALFLLTSGRVQSLARFRLAGLRIPLFVFDLAVFMGLLAGLVVLHLAVFSLSWADLAMPRPFWNRSGTAQELFVRCSVVLGILLPLALSTFLVMKLVGTRWLGKGWVFLMGAIWVFFLGLVPALLVALSKAFAQADNLGIRPWKLPIYALAMTSPTTQGMAMLEQAPRWIRSEHWLLTRGYWFWHALLLAYLGALSWRMHRSTLQEAAVFESLDPHSDAEAAGHPPCPECESLLQVPQPYSDWGGMWITSLFKTVRCLDCSTEFDSRTGKVHKQRNFYLALIRTGATGAGLVALTLVLLRFA
ncbi:MAG TPA: hypothetical protein DEA08_32025 [Planctomycetes bacterium]|nr:hypothetical protein [Planctomycetota bacterium]